MKASRLAALIVCLTGVVLSTSCKRERPRPADPAVVLQEDRDGIRLEHLLYWTGLIEEFHAKTGEYPLQKKVKPGLSKHSTGLVLIATKTQQKYFDPKSADYRPKLDANAGGSFQELTVSEFIKELEVGLGRKIDEKYDVQKAPVDSVVWYPYFVSDKGYLMWVTCVSCGITTASTLTMDGTPTVNIGARPLITGVPKAMTRTEMMDHPDFKKWLAVPFHEEAAMRALEAANHSDSK